MKTTLVEVGITLAWVGDYSGKDGALLWQGLGITLADMGNYSCSGGDYSSMAERLL